MKLVFSILIIMAQTCFKIYFNPIYIYLKRVYNLTFDNDNYLLIFSLSASTLMTFLTEIFNINFFGVSNSLLLIIISTILIDAIYGVKRSLKESRIAKIKAISLPVGPERKKYIRIYQLKKFSSRKLQFTFFKALTLLAYLFVIKNILSYDDNETVLSEILGLSTAIVLKIPLTIFWYYDFKSIGDNMAFLLGKKPPIFVIIEKIFELRLGRFFKTGSGLEHHQDFSEELDEDFDENKN